MSPVASRSLGTPPCVDLASVGGRPFPLVDFFLSCDNRNSWIQRTGSFVAWAPGRRIHVHLLVTHDGPFPRTRVGGRNGRRATYDFGLAHHRGAS
jgi:hypothetical protein